MVARIARARRTNSRSKVRPTRGFRTRNRVGVMHREIMSGAPAKHQRSISGAGRCNCTCNNMMQPPRVRWNPGIPEAGARPSLTERRPWGLKTSFCSLFLLAYPKPGAAERFSDRSCVDADYQIQASFFCYGATVPPVIAAIDVR